MTTRYTEFPNLKAVEEELLEDVDHQISTHVSAEVNLDLLLISWAILLRSYTEEKAPVFRIHEDSVVVNTSDLASTVISKVSPVEGYKYTGIVGLDVSPCICRRGLSLIVVGTSA